MHNSEDDVAVILQEDAACLEKMKKRKKNIAAGKYYVGLIIYICNHVVILCFDSVVIS